jgi:hypothetical protein
MILRILDEIMFILTFRTGNCDHFIYINNFELSLYDN